MSKQRTAHFNDGVVVARSSDEIEKMDEYGSADIQNQMDAGAPIGEFIQKDEAENEIRGEWRKVDIEKVDVDLHHLGYHLITCPQCGQVHNQKMLERVYCTEDGYTELLVCTACKLEAPSWDYPDLLIY